MSNSLFSAHLRFDSVSKSFGARRVLTDISFAVPAGSRVGLIGENGSGKSTLLRIAAGLTGADAGSVTAIAPGGRAASIGLLHQEPPFGPTDTIRTAIHAATAPVRAALAALEQLSEELAVHPEAPDAGDAYAEALDTVERLSAWELDTRVERMLAGLGIAQIPRDRATRSLSGGQRARLSLAWLLLNAPDVLLLDEPTNHLDDSASEFLTRTLTTWRGPVLFASHDRAFLDEAATALVDLDPAPLPESIAATLVQDGTGSGIGVTRFTGSYTDYVTAQRDARRRWSQQYSDEQAELRRLRAAVGDNQIVGHVDWKPRSESRMAQKFYADRNARVVARRVNDARSRLDTLTARQISRPHAPLTFAGIAAPSAPNGAAREPERSAGGPPVSSGNTVPAVTLMRVAVEGRLPATSLEVLAGEKWLLTGANGAGKSTLLRTIAGLVQADEGAVTIAPDMRVGILEQENMFADPRGVGTHRTAQETYVDGVGIERATAIPLEQSGLLALRDEAQPLAALSTGQQRRLALAILIAVPPDILLLDEPTNHLSLTLAGAIEEAVAAFPGTVIVASHDRWLRRRWQGSHIELKPTS